MIRRILVVTVACIGLIGCGAGDDPCADEAFYQANQIACDAQWKGEEIGSIDQSIGSRGFVTLAPKLASPIQQNACEGILDQEVCDGAESCIWDPRYESCTGR